MTSFNISVAWWTLCSRHICPSLWSDNNLGKQQQTFWVFSKWRVHFSFLENNERLYFVKHLMLVGGLINRFIVCLFIRSCWIAFSFFESNSNSLVDLWWRKYGREWMSWKKPETCQNSRISLKQKTTIKRQKSILRLNKTPNHEGFTKDSIDGRSRRSITCMTMWTILMVEWREIGNAIELQKRYLQWFASGIFTFFKKILKKKIWKKIDGKWSREVDEKIIFCCYTTPSIELN